ncbi:hypothetical protein NQ317_008670 [Molorchus minor]|uniref:BESS domain-containing protein n=1 Tax=Molorchus minor TaxID=1323400 RepID=A0ABQ9K1J0_9CUCU|nr:hypothetical protein NQ317_008670 [Molorchus minor]
MKFIRPSNISFSSDDKSHLFLINDIEDQQSHSDTGLMEEFPVQNLKREFTKSNCAETETKDAVVAIKTPDSKYREDCQIFGDFVASELQSLSEPTRKKLKRRILRAILDVSSLEDLSPISTSPVLYDSSPHS